MEVTNILAIAGGTGVSLTLPVILTATSSSTFGGAAIDFIWIIRRSSNVQWIFTGLEELKRRSRTMQHLNFNIHIFVTQKYDTKATTESQTRSEEKAVDIRIEPLTEAGSLSSSLDKRLDNVNSKVTYLNSHHPTLQDVVSNFIETRANFDYRTRVIASGPAGMGQDLKAAVARMNDGGKVWEGERRWDVDLHWDDRMC